MEIGEEFTIPARVRDVYGNKVGKTPVVLESITDDCIMVRSKWSNTTIQLHKPIEMYEQVPMKKPFTVVTILIVICICVVVYLWKSL